MSGLLKEKVCLVTGAAQGIGKAIAKRFVEEEAIVYAADLQDDKISNWAEELSAHIKNNIIPVRLDVTDVNDIKSCAMQVKKECGHLDVLVNDAGVEYNELIGMITEEHLRNMMEVNVVGTINMVQYFSKIMLKSNCASIINIASMVGMRGNPGQSAYAASKGAVIAFTKSAAKELGPKSIRVNAIAPGLTDTGMFQQADREKLEKRIENISLGRIAEPLDIALACTFLASDLSRYVSGQILGVDGCAIL